VEIRATFDSFPHFGGGAGRMNPHRMPWSGYRVQAAGGHLSSACTLTPATPRAGLVPPQLGPCLVDRTFDVRFDESLAADRDNVLTHACDDRVGRD
jgi:hypothetical protein